MRDFDSGPLDGGSREDPTFDAGALGAPERAELVARAVSEIDASSEDLRDVLLFDLLSAAWPEPVAQNQ